jgi:hypothetical protein
MESVPTEKIRIYCASVTNRTPTAYIFRPPHVNIYFDASKPVIYGQATFSYIIAKLMLTFLNSLFFLNQSLNYIVRQYNLNFITESLPKTLMIVECS